MSSTQKTIDKFNQAAQKSEQKLKKNPFSDTYQPPEFDKTSKEYGRPPPGSKTEAREKCKFGQVDILVRKKQLHFMLYQKQDDHKIIRLLKPMDEIRKSLVYSGDPSNCIIVKK